MQITGLKTEGGGFTIEPPPITTFLGTLQTPTTPSNSYVTGYGNTKDSAGNTYVTGFAYDTTAAGGWFIVKYNNQGALVWQKRLSAGDVIGYAVAIDNTTGEIYATGSKSSGGPNSCYIIKLDATGNTVWQKTYGPDTFVGRGLAVDSNGLLYLSGYVNLSAVNGGDGLWVAKFNGATGAVMWQKKVATGDRIFNYSIVTDYNNDVITTVQAVDISINVLRTIIIKFIYVDGTITWRQEWLQTATTYGFVSNAPKASVDSLGYVFTTGTTNSPQSGTMVVAKINPLGALQWQKSINNTTNSGYSINAYGTTVDSLGNLYIIGNNQLSSTNTAIYIVSFDTNGNIRWQKNLYQTDGLSRDTGLSIAVGFDSQGNENLYFSSGDLNTPITSTTPMIFGSIPTTGVAPSTITVGGVSYTWATATNTNLLTTTLTFQVAFSSNDPTVFIPNSSSLSPVAGALVSTITTI